MIASHTVQNGHYSPSVPDGWKLSQSAAKGGQLLSHLGQVGGLARGAMECKYYLLLINWGAIYEATVGWGYWCATSLALVCKSGTNLPELREEVTVRLEK